MSTSLNLEPRSVVCPAPSSLVFCVLFKCIFSPSLQFSIVITVKAIKYINKINKSDRAGGTGAEPTHTQVP